MAQSYRMLKLPNRFTRLEAIDKVAFTLSRKRILDVSEDVQCPVTRVAAFAQALADDATVLELWEESGDTSLWQERAQRCYDERLLEWFPTISTRTAPMAPQGLHRLPELQEHDIDELLLRINTVPVHPQRRKRSLAEFLGEDDPDCAPDAPARKRVRRLVDGEPKDIEQLWQRADPNDVPLLRCLQQGSTPPPPPTPVEGTNTNVPASAPTSTPCLKWFRVCEKSYKVKAKCAECKNDFQPYRNEYRMFFYSPTAVYVNGGYGYPDGMSVDKFCRDCRDRFKQQKAEV